MTRRTHPVHAPHARRRPGPGDAISSFAFAGVAVWLADAATIAEGLRAAVLWVTAITCAAAAFRHPLARLADRLGI